MGFKATTIVRQADLTDMKLTPAQRFVLHLIAEHANDQTDLAWPSNQTLALESDTKRPTVNAAVSRLKALGLITPTGSTRSGVIVYRVETELISSKRRAYYDTQVSDSPVEVSDSHVAGVRFADTEQPSNQPSEQPPPTPSLTLVMSDASSPDSFEAFWKVYPRKRGMGTAERAWAKAVKTTPGHVIIADVVRRLPWFEQQKANPRGDMRPYPGTWLNDKRWNDELETRPTPADWRPAPDADEQMAAAAAERATAGAPVTPEERARIKAELGIVDPRKTRRNEWSAG